MRVDLTAENAKIAKKRRQRFFEIFAFFVVDWNAINLFHNVITGRLKMVGRIQHALSDESLAGAIQREIGDALRSEFWQPGQRTLFGE
jgi:hypothetical protein